MVSALFAIPKFCVVIFIDTGRCHPALSCDPIGTRYTDFEKMALLVVGQAGSKIAQIRSDYYLLVSG